jgi:hypothetical protein
MSGFIVGKSDDAFHIFTDGGVFDHQGVLVGTTQKTTIFAQMPAAMTIIGSRAWMLATYPDFSCCPSFDHLVDRTHELPQYMPIAERIAAQEKTSADFEMVMVGYSARHGRLASYMVSNHSLPGGGEPWKLREIEEPILNPPPSQEALAAVGWQGSEFDLGRDGPQIMCAQRLTQFAHADGSLGCGIGGFIQHTIVTRDRITTRIVHRWPDELGKRIVG